MSTATTGPRQGLEARGATLRYPHGPTITADLDLTIRPGGFTVIVGANACGKSTLLKALARVLVPQDGTVLLDGVDAHAHPPKSFATRVGYLPQSAIAPDGITVGELVARGRYPHQTMLRQWSAADRRAVDAALDRTRLDDLVDRPVAALSGGQRQRVWIAMALAQQTEILLLDEPTTFLDLAHQVDVLELCHELNTAEGTTVVAVLHDLNQACRYADEIIVMKGGAVTAIGAPDEVITADVVHDAFGLDVRVIEDPVTGTPLVLPLTGPRRRTPTERTAP